MRDSGVVVNKVFCPCVHENTGAFLPLEDKVHKLGAAKILLFRYFFENGHVLAERIQVITMSGKTITAQMILDDEETERIYGSWNGAKVIFVR